MSDLLELVLQERYLSHAAVNRVTEPRLRLVRQRCDSPLPLRRAKVVEQLCDVAGTEDSMDIGELRRLVGGEVGREHAALSAFPTEELAGCTGRV